MAAILPFLPFSLYLGTDEAWEVDFGVYTQVMRGDKHDTSSMRDFYQCSHIKFASICIESYQNGRNLGCFYISPIILVMERHRKLTYVSIPRFRGANMMHGSPSRYPLVEIRPFFKDFSEKFTNRCKPIKGPIPRFGSIPTDLYPEKKKVE